MEITLNSNKLTMSVREMAASLQICKDTAYTLAHHEKFYPTIRINKRIIISVPAFKKWLQDANFQIDPDDDDND